MIMPNHSPIAILPQPASLQEGEGAFPLSHNTKIIVDRETQAAGMLLASILEPALGFRLSVYEESALDEPAILLSIDPTLTHLNEEGYQLVVTPQQVVLHSSATTGILHGIQTLRQLLPSEIFSKTPVARDWFIPSVTIEDFPRFSWRGFMLDTVRHFVPKEELFKLVDLLAIHKLNVFHLHLTDDQGWRIEIKQYPKLTEIGAWRKASPVGNERMPLAYDGIPHGGFYTQDELRELVAYAAARGITIVPEIEMPGHAQAAIAAYPELGVTDEPVEVCTRWSISPYLFNPAPETIHFLQNVLSETMEIFPSIFIHIGGDEAIKDQWKSSSQVQERIHALGLKDEDELQSWFISQMEVFLAQHGRRLVGWDEILEGGLPEGATVMSWRGINGGLAAARAHHDVVMAPNDYVYLDHYQSNDPAEPLALGGYTPIDKIYGYDPIPTELPADLAHHILGAQCELWSEYIPTIEHMEYMTFPRAIALAEITWTPQSRRDFADFRQRLTIHEARLHHLQVNAWPLARWDKESTFPPRQ
jgi:hexosaminidase